MKDETIHKIINQLNRGKFKGQIYTRKLDDTVEYARLWLEKVNPNDATCKYIDNLRPYRFYFIKTQDGLYAGAVLDMNSDLHWYIMPKQRGRGLLSQVLMNHILPHLFLSRDEQRITIDKGFLGTNGFMASEKIATRMGFVKYGEKCEKHMYVLKEDAYMRDDYYDGQNEKFTEERVNTLRQQMGYATYCLLVVQAELEMKMGVCEYTEELKQTISEVERQINKLHGLPLG